VPHQQMRMARAVSTSPAQPKLKVLCVCCCVRRTRAAVPQPSRMDFVINPGSRVDPLDGPMQLGSKGKPGGGKPKVRLLSCFVAAACGSVTVTGMPS
jgi:hypothetical protein